MREEEGNDLLSAGDPTSFLEGDALGFTEMERGGSMVHHAQVSIPHSPQKNGRQFYESAMGEKEWGKLHLGSRRS